MRKSTLEWLKILQNYKKRGITVIHRSALQAIYDGEKSSLRTILYRLEKNGLLQRIARNWYCIPPCEIFEIVKVVFPSSYISLEWALHYHDIIDQRTNTITLIWLKKPKIIKNTYTFEIHKIKEELYFGFDKDKRIAEPEKAILDTIYLRKKLPSELNIELLDKNKIQKYSKHFPRRVHKTIEKLL